MTIPNAHARKTLMIRPLVAIVLVTMGFFAGYVIGMFHTMYYLTQDKVNLLPHSKEKVITHIALESDK